MFGVACISKTIHFKQIKMIFQLYRIKYESRIHNIYETNITYSYKVFEFQLEASSSMLRTYESLWQTPWKNKSLTNIILRSFQNSRSFSIPSNANRSINVTNDSDQSGRILLTVQDLRESNLIQDLDK